jgi:hypothetical protein
MAIQIRRREFMTLLSGAAAWPLGARAAGGEVANHRVLVAGIRPPA